MNTGDREELRDALKNQQSREEGKRLLKALAGCEKGKDVMDLLHAELPDAELKKSIADVSDMDVINKLHAVEAFERMKRGTQGNQDFVCAAAQTWKSLTGKDVKAFKNLVNSNLAAKSNTSSMQRNAEM